MKTSLMLSALVVLTGVTACGQPVGTAFNPAESEPDYGPGFFDSKSDTTQEDYEGGEINGELPKPEDVEEIIQRKGSLQMRLSFPQTVWNECTDKPVSGNYETYACAKGRNISVILDSYLQERFLKCVDAGIAAQGGGGTVVAAHVTHAGVTADPRHSPLSLHAHNRAIDVKVITAKLAGGVERQYSYAKVGNRPFYTALRKCWGETVHTENGCPYYGGTSGLTGSIGWENSDHGRHMHLSVPYCTGGAYGTGVWRR